MLEINFGFQVLSIAGMLVDSNKDEEKKMDVSTSSSSDKGENKSEPVKTEEVQAKKTDSEF